MRHCKGVRLTRVDRKPSLGSPPGLQSADLVAQLRRDGSVRFIDDAFAMSPAGSSGTDRPVCADLIDLLWHGFVEAYVCNAWLSGEAAIAALALFDGDINFAGTREADASWTAIAYACESLLQTQEAVSDVLYHHGQIPVGEDEIAACERLVVRADAQLAKHGWRGAAAGRNWHRWHDQRSSLEAGCFKMYVSVPPGSLDVLGETFWRSVGASPAVSCKIVAPLGRLGRSDGLCIYFAGLSDLLRTERSLRATVTVKETRAVPFALAFENVGPACWGVDPVTDDNSSRSWRGDLADALAAEIVRIGPVFDPAGRNWRRIALAVRDRGIDPFTWRPIASGELGVKTVSSNGC